MPGYSRLRVLFIGLSILCLLCKEDVAIILVSAGVTPDVVEECCKCGVRYIVVESAGFAELGPEGKKIEFAMLEIADKYGVRLLGPNCLGLINTSHRLNASFSRFMPPAGGISVISQSGALCTAVLEWAWLSLNNSRF